MTNLTKFRNFALPVLLIGALSLAACGGGDDDAAGQSKPAAAQVSEDQKTGSPPDMPEVIPPETPLKAPPEVPEELRIIWEVWDVIRREHVDRSEFDTQEITEGAIRGMLSALDDPHTAYASPQFLSIENQDLQGNFEGIGAHVSMRRDGKLIIIAPIEGGPAKAAGIRPGDVILEADGRNLEGMSLLEAVTIIRGPRGTKVVLLVLHLGEIDPVQIAVTRDVIPLNSVLLRSQPGDDIAHIRVTDFFADTAGILVGMIDQAVDDGARGLIIDVRDNPGGLLSAAVDVTSQFLTDGLVLYEVDGAGRRTNFKVRKGGVAQDIPMVLLTNGGSASASEILAGALQDHKRAVVIGATTFGKGTVNSFRRLSNDAGLYISIARYFTPNGRIIEGVGVEPDIEVTARERDQAEAKQLEKALEVLRSKIASQVSAQPSS